MTKILLTKINFNEGTELKAAEALDAQGGEIEFDAVDAKTLIVVENTGTQPQTITFKKGCGIQGVADLDKEIAQGKTQGFVLESGAFKTKGFIYVSGDVSLKISAYLLP